MAKYFQPTQLAKLDRMWTEEEIGQAKIGFWGNLYSKQEKKNKPLTLEDIYIHEGDLYMDAEESGFDFSESLINCYNVIFEWLKEQRLFYRQLSLEALVAAKDTTIDLLKSVLYDTVWAFSCKQGLSFANLELPEKTKVYLCSLDPINTENACSMVKPCEMVYKRDLIYGEVLEVISKKLKIDANLYKSPFVSDLNYALAAINTVTLASNVSCSAAFDLEESLTGTVKKNLDKKIIDLFNVTSIRDFSSFVSVSEKNDNRRFIRESITSLAKDTFAEKQEGDSDDARNG